MGALRNDTTDIPLSDQISRWMARLLFGPGQAGRTIRIKPVPSLAEACCNRVRSCVEPGLGEAMIRTTVLRALVLTAAVAAALTPVTCLGEDSNPPPVKAPKLPAKATKNLPPELLS